MSYVLGIDLGTSYFKVALFDRGGVLRGMARLRVPARRQAGRCELDVSACWELLEEGVAQACAQAGTSAGHVESISYSSQANSFVLLNAASQPLTPIILWPDLRAGEMGARMRRLWDHPDFLQTTGLGLCSSEFMAAKLEWFQEQLPEVWHATRHIMTISDLLVYGLTGHQKGDAGTASLLGLFDLRRARWWPQALEAMSLDEARLSRPELPGTLLGSAQGSVAQRLNFSPKVPVMAGSLDHHMAALGAGLGTVAEATDSTGTVLALLRNAERWEPRAGCCMGPGMQGAGYFQLSFSNAGAGMLESYQREHAPEYTLEALLALAEQSTLHGEGHGPRVRNLLEQAAQTLKGLAETLYGGGRPGRLVATGGGARSDLWLQLKADCLGVEFVVTECREPACLGAAMLAATGAGWFSNFADVSSAWTSLRKVFSPKEKMGAAFVRGRELRDRVSAG